MSRFSAIIYNKKSLIQFEWSFFSVCGHVSVSLGREEKDKHVPFSLQNLSESFFSCLGARTEVPVYPKRERERERGLAGRRVTKETGNSAGMVVKGEGVWADRDNWRRQGTPLCIKILHTPF